VYIRFRLRSTKVSSNLRVASPPKQSSLSAVRTNASSKYSSSCANAEKGIRRKQKSKKEKRREQRSEIEKSTAHSDGEDRASRYDSSYFRITRSDKLLD
jgi:hypothetical protein